MLLRHHPSSPAAPPSHSIVVAGKFKSPARSSPLLIDCFRFARSLHSIIVPEIFAPVTKIEIDGDLFRDEALRLRKFCMKSK
ncbi:unnamed protein product [Cuscuta europaea]|uniref:Uncharacterized protein n=1 Tax=Cuscuta europaea TaxID=41803 RepID=A0A9P0ZL98_CUSEU|nr:unnamed protein product [Cuscuta europaea]